MLLLFLDGDYSWCIALIASIKLLSLLNRIPPILLGLVIVGRPHTRIMLGQPSQVYLLEVLIVRRHPDLQAVRQHPRRIMIILSDLHRFHAVICLAEHVTSVWQIRSPTHFLIGLIHGPRCRDEAELLRRALLVLVLRAPSSVPLLLLINPLIWIA
jgi:hypothetical protein